MFEYNETEYQQIRNSVIGLAGQLLKVSPSNEHKSLKPKDLFHSLAKLGICGIAIEERLGGLEKGPIVASIVMEELAAVDLGPAIFISVHNMVANIIQKYGSPEQKDRVLPNMCSGKMLGAFALTEPLAGSDASALRTTYKEANEGYVLNGEKCYITSAGFADLYIVFARSLGTSGPNGIAAFIVEDSCDNSSNSIKFSAPEEKMGGDLSPISSITFSNHFIPANSIIGSPNQGYAIALSGLAGGRINIAASANGISRTAIQIALAHLKDRQQFGKPLIDFQGLQFILADMQIKLSASQLLTWQAARSLEDEPEAQINRINPSIAKCFASDSAMQITTDAVQLLGGAGYIKDYGAEKLMRDAKMLQIVEGTNQIQRMIIAREMAKDLA